MPFLLPLFFQLGFGLSPLQSGLLTFASAVGAIAMKTTAAPIIRRFGFKRVLVTNAVVSSLFLAAIALFTAGTPHSVVLAVLLVGGFFKSLEFTSINAIAYADIDSTRHEPGHQLRQRGAAAVAARPGVAVRRAGARDRAHGPARRERRGGRFPAGLHPGRRRSPQARR